MCTVVSTTGADLAFILTFTSTSTGPLAAVSCVAEDDGLGRLLACLARSRGSLGRVVRRLRGGRSWDLSFVEQRDGLTTQPVGRWGGTGGRCMRAACRRRRLDYMYGGLSITSYSCRSYMRVLLVCIPTTRQETTMSCRHTPQKEIARTPNHLTTSYACVCRLVGNKRPNDRLVGHTLHCDLHTSA
jgi:hypothetical protein